ncbi:MAG TPA: FGGY family carbohydrate kinase, partial [Propionibacteriaceae bacterium]|nr:FGGY family carbohydrate kinase [Propionibacteriaceae bacterium]
MILSIDQGTTNTKAVLVDRSGQVVGSGAAPVGLSSPRPGWVEQDADEVWSSVLAAVATCRAADPDATLAGVT